MKENETYTCNHFSLALPAGKNQDDIPGLLEHLAKNLREDKISSDSVMDIVFQNEVDNDGEMRPSFTVYYSEEN